MDGYVKEVGESLGLLALAASMVGGCLGLSLLLVRVVG